MATSTTAPPAPVAAAPDLDAVVLELLQARKGDWKRIAAESGGIVSYSWISKFVNGHIPNAGVSTLKALRTWLEAHPPAYQVSAPPAADAGGTSSQGAASGPPA